MNKTFLIILIPRTTGRCDRYNHSEVDTDEAAESTEPNDEAGLFAAFSSTSPQWRRHQPAATHDSRVRASDCRCR